MSNSAAGGYVGPSTNGSDLIDLHVLCLSGDGCVLNVGPSTLGREVREMVSEQFPPKRGTTLVLHYLALPLILHQTLREQGVEGRTATLSCTFIPVNLYAAWCYAKGFSVPTE